MLDRSGTEISDIVTEAIIWCAGGLYECVLQCTTLHHNVSHKSHPSYVFYTILPSNEALQSPLESATGSLYIVHAPSMSHSYGLP
jgi:hypothetical protein